MSKLCVKNALITRKINLIEDLKLLNTFLKKVNKNKSLSCQFGMFRKKQINLNCTKYNMLNYSLSGDMYVIFQF